MTEVRTRTKVRGMERNDLSKEESEEKTYVMIFIGGRYKERESAEQRKSKRSVRTKAQL